VPDDLKSARVVPLKETRCRLETTDPQADPEGAHPARAP